ncbi:ATPase, T2SS/T4P/T4SS family [Lysinibacillus sp. NPDC097287]|uniref:ATPase, T2SS/T4P/T4SS family n=1 Tax=Lysinibacillus sp. NPDC097287 TaxID=3364144 RepID=UPI00382BBD74
MRPILSMIDLLERAYTEKNSETIGIPPVNRMHGQLEQYGDVPILFENFKKMIHEILPDYKMKEFEEKEETDFDFSLAEKCRFRVNVYHRPNEVTIAALRQDLDSILVGEMRDLEIITTAVTAAETGHLVMATLPTNSAATTINRIIDILPPPLQSQIPSVMQTSSALGMHTLVSSMQQLIASGKISVECTSPFMNAGDYS